jgi:hypothetical protein
MFTDIDLKIELDKEGRADNANKKQHEYYQ